MKTILVTGSTSFLGVYLIHQLLEAGYTVFAVIKPNSRKLKNLPNHKNLIVLELDFANIQELKKIIKTKITVLYHLAWNGTRGNDRDNRYLQETNINQGYQILETVAGLGCQFIIDAGSTAEYGSYNDCIDENFICYPITEYGKAKLKFYNITTDFCKKNAIHYKHTRIFSLYGPGDFEGTLIMSMLKKMIVGEDLLLTECSQNWDFLFVEDAANGFLKLCEIPCSDGIYNLASGNNQFLRDFILSMYQLTNSKSKIFFGRIPYPSTGKVSINLNISKLTKETGWIPKTTFIEGIKAILKTNPFRELNDENH